jgi:hypothetical protein
MMNKHLRRAVDMYRIKEEKKEEVKDKKSEKKETDMPPKQENTV